MDTFNVMIVTLGEGGPSSALLFDQHAPKADRYGAAMFPLPEDCWEGNDHLHYPVYDGTTQREVCVDIRTGKDGNDCSRTPLALSAPAPNRFLAERVVAAIKTVQWLNEKRTLEGVLTYPPESVARPPYKLIVFPHGGPHSRSTTDFNFTTQVFAAQGYLVFQPNFRGSSGYGQKLIDADRHDFGGGDMRDILTGIDHLVKEKLVDPKRQFVYGTSYGGFMTTWLVGHTNQFRAAVAQNAVTDLNAMWGLSDIQSWTEWEFGGKPWEVPEAMRKHSPLTYAANVRTPTLILHARDDRRCPLPMGKMFHQALKSRGVPTQMVIYPNEGHGIKQPRHQEDVLKRALDWFAKYDKE